MSRRARRTFPAITPHWVLATRRRTATGLWISERRRGSWIRTETRFVRGRNAFRSESAAAVASLRLHSWTLGSAPSYAARRMLVAIRASAFACPSLVSPLLPVNERIHPTFCSIQMWHGVTKFACHNSRHRIRQSEWTCYLRVCTESFQLDSIGPEHPILWIPGLRYSQRTLHYCQLRGFLRAQNLLQLRPFLFF